MWDAEELGRAMLHEQQSGCDAQQPLSVPGEALGNDS
jgi:hypothetical protein